MLKHNVKKIVFSSTASIYGEPNESMISEEHAQLPINVYGQTKLTIEKILKALFYSDNLCSISLRYFNAAGADPCGLIGEAHPNETHLIPNAINSLLKNNSDEFHVFGNTYNTKDGTCVRDYIHVNDLATAHFLGLQYLKNKEVCESYNLGAGKGFSVLEILNTIEQISGKKVNFSFKEKRVGDPAILVADIKRARKDLNWNPIFSDISTIIRDAFNWHSKGI
jgi:UDP-glucose 4-epimerase